MHSLNAIDHNFVLNFAEETLTNWTISRKNEKNRAYTSGKPCINSKISFQAYEEECKEEAKRLGYQLVRMTKRPFTVVLLINGKKNSAHATYRNIIITENT